jgi:arsenite methyltransferase
MTRDLMHQQDIRDSVREAYAAIEADSRVVAEQLYSEEQLALVPDVALDHALGVGNHVPFAGLAPGDTVLDLGCGAGIDTVLAAHAVGPGGRVIALDFLPEMLARTEEAARQAGLGNVETVEAEMESIPLEDGTVDHVIANGTINLSPRKARVLAECARVLRAGGGLTVADLTVDEEDLPPQVYTHPAAWAG